MKEMLLSMFSSLVLILLPFSRLPPRRNVSVHGARLEAIWSVDRVGRCNTRERVLVVHPRIAQRFVWSTSLRLQCLHVVVYDCVCAADGLLGQYRMVKNEDETSAQTCIFIGEKPEYDESKFIPVPVKKGKHKVSL